MKTLSSWPNIDTSTMDINEEKSTRMFSAFQEGQEEAEGLSKRKCAYKASRRARH